MKVIWPIVLLPLALPSPLRAGMPQVDLSYVTAARLDSISFFVVLFLFSAWLIQFIWNTLARDFPKLPILSYGRALCLTAIWGLLFVIVLTMISGAHELLTPGALGARRRRLSAQE
ncbi:MAG: hypothetical protein QM775_26890 [Pirellulales bacterium]